MVMYRLLQARIAKDPVREEERHAFSQKLGVTTEQVLPYDLLEGNVTYERATEGVHAVLVGGSGEFGVLDPVPWMPPFLRTMKALADHRFPTFASCFGFQALCKAMGGSVQTLPERSEVGSYDLRLTDNGKSDPLFQHLPHSFVAQEGHKDSVVTLPEGCVPLATSARCQHQALRVTGALVYATQFHPELSDGEQRARFSRYFDLYKGIFGETRAKAILDEMRPSVAANELLARFHTLVSTHSNTITEQTPPTIEP